jgi:hypothetical protein
MVAKPEPFKYIVGWNAPPPEALKLEGNANILSGACDAGGGPTGAPAVSPPDGGGAMSAAPAVGPMSLGETPEAAAAFALLAVFAVLEGLLAGV